MIGRRLLAAGVALGSLTLVNACLDDGGPAADTTSSTAVADAEATLALRGDGLGLVAFGDQTADVVAAVTGALGDPTEDSGWVPASGPFGNCSGQEVRGVEWDGLQLLFSESDADPVPGGRFLAWDLSGVPPALAMATGFGFGATTDDAHELYGQDAQLVEAEDPYPAYLRIHIDGAEVSAFVDDNGMVTNLHGGGGCGE